MKKILILEDSLERCETFKKNFLNAELIFVDIPNNAIELLKTQKFDYLFLTTI